jgi:signal transduction histidine kinase
MKIENLTWIGLLTWLIIAVPSVYAALTTGLLARPEGWAWLGCFVLFIILYLFATRTHATTPRLLLIAGESIAALACIALVPAGFQPILLVIIAAQLGVHHFRTALLATFLQTIALAVVLTVSGGENAIAVAFAYFAFQLFGAYTASVARAESEARLALAAVNAELEVTSGLLEISTRTSERLRIARDLHDLVGHHLAALSLNLEVASHLTEGKAREQVEKSRGIAKTLLSDVRDVVSRMREDDAVDLGIALRALRDVITRPAIHLDLPHELPVRNSAVAQVALRAVQEIVTNTVRHAGAKNLWLRVALRESQLEIEARDDGAGVPTVQFGNGLRGLKERVEGADGRLDVSSVPGSGFTVHVALPLEVRS